MPEFLSGKDKNEMTIVIDGVEATITSAKFVRTMDTCADAMTAIMPWFPDPEMDGYNIEINRVTRPYSYKPISIYLGGNLHSKMILYNITQRKGSDGWTKDLEAYSQTADIIDSTVISPYEARQISLENRCKQQCEPFGINVLVGDGVNLTRKRRVQIPQYTKKISFVQSFNNELVPTYAIASLNSIQVIDTNTYKKPKTITITEEDTFPRVSAKRTETVFSHLSKLAQQKGFLLSCSKYGDLLITKANTTDPPVAVFDDSSSNMNVLDVKFDGRKRWQYYKAIAQSSRRGRSQRTSIAQDKVVTSNRLLSFDAGDIIPGSANSSAEWKKNKSAADALTFDLPVNSWYNDNGKLWEPNTTVSIKSFLINDFENGFTFLITKVEFAYDENGAKATLSLKPPSLYSSGTIVEPWI